MTTQTKLHESVVQSAATKKLVGSKFRSIIVAANRWGSSAYYPAEVLERDGSRVFPAGTQMYANHQDENEKFNRPERSIHDIVGSLASDAVFEDGEEGLGLYADVEFHESFVNRINELKKDVGLSINATGLTEDAEMDGRYGPVLVGLLASDSVDVVTRAGAGGKLISIIESDQGPAGVPVEPRKDQSVTDVTKEDFEALKSTLVEAIKAIPAALAESLKPAEETVVVTETPEAKAAREAAEAEAKAKDEDVEIDYAAVSTAVVEAGLPASSIALVAAGVKTGKTLEESLKVQTDYRDALVAGTESGTVTRLGESDKPKGLAYAVSKLNG